MRKYLDTNVVLRLIIKDVESLTAKAIALTQTDINLRISDQVFIETEYALVKHYGLSRADAAEALSMLCKSSVAETTDLIATVIELYSKLNAVSLTDIYIHRNSKCR